MYGDYDSDDCKFTDSLIIARSETEKLKEKLRYVKRVLDTAVNAGSLDRCRQACENMSIYLNDI
jgi:hypothetical protein